MLSKITRRAAMAAAGAIAAASLLPQAAASTMKTAKRETTMENFDPKFPVGAPNDAYAQYFSGKSWLSMLTTEGVVTANVTFEPGCRNNWHIHHKGGQILLCVAGRGYCQLEGEPARELHAGDVFYIPPEVKHWHGAAPTCWFSHIAVEVPADGQSNEWLEPVSDEEYSKLA